MELDKVAFHQLGFENSMTLADYITTSTDASAGENGGTVFEDGKY